MKVHKYVDGSCFTLKILCPEVKEVAQEQLKRLQGLVEKPMSLDKLHLGLKYLGYETDHEDEYIKSLIPEIKPIVKRYLPLEIEIEGVGAFYDTPEWPSKTIIFLKVKENKRLRAFHDELRTSLK
ncbi:MAG: 2'-5' RNA ligase family protein, partial [Candidatus Nanoarchaeia archaeon]